MLRNIKHTHSHARTHTHMHARMHARTHNHTHACTHAPHTRTLARTHTHTHTHMHAREYAQKHTHTRKHAYTHTHSQCYSIFCFVLFFSIPLGRLIAYMYVVRIPECLHLFWFPFRFCILILYYLVLFLLNSSVVEYCGCRN